MPLPQSHSVPPNHANHFRKFAQKEWAKRSQGPIKYQILPRKFNTNTPHSAALLQWRVWAGESPGFWFFPNLNLLMASMAAIGVPRVPSSSTSSSSQSNSSNLNRRTPVQSLSFSSSSISGDKIYSKVFSARRGNAYNEKTPRIVSPKAVSDSRNSQTCLDPDASRVSFLPSFLFVLSFISFVQNLLSVWCLDPSFHAVINMDFVYLCLWCAWIGTYSFSM